MGKKSNYFRHSLSAHSDPKIINLMSKRGGLAGVGFFWILLEIYGRSLMDDDEQEIEQGMHVRTVSTATGLRSDSVRTLLRVCTELGLIDTVWDKVSQSQFTLSVPNFSKYFGKYTKTEHVKCPNKRKEKKRKEKKRGSGQKPKKIEEGYTEKFEQLYILYPKKEGKKAGFKTYTKEVNNEEIYSKLMTALLNYNKKVQFEQTSRQFIKKFSSFMEEWEDFIDYEPNGFTQVPGQTIEKQTFPDCQVCHNRGTVSQSTDVGIVLYRCHCARGKFEYPNLPEIND